MLFVAGTKHGEVPICFTANEIPFDVAVGVLAQAKLEVNTTLNRSPLLKLLPVNAWEVAVEMAVPLMYHW